MTEETARAAQASPVRIEQNGDVGVIVIDNPPVNAGSRAVRAGLLDALHSIEADPTIHAAVLIGAGRSFIAGSDLREFDLPLAEPELPAVIDAIERMGKPVVAALHGAALGGGYELALGCDGRLAARGTLLGLPEATLGMIPGAGGTQRLTRLVGRVVAIDLICSGRRVEAVEARALGMIDQLVEGDLRAAAVAHASAIAGRKHLVSERPVPETTPEAEEKAAAAALKAGRDRPHIAAAIRHVRAAGHVPIGQALAEERAEFQRLRIAPDARALRYLFFAERDAARGAGPAGTEPRSFTKFGVIGAGTMGVGIATAVLQAGFPVTVVERDDATLERGKAAIRANIKRRAASGKLDAEPDALLSGLNLAHDLDALSDCDVIIEAVVENLGIKQEVFRALDGIVPHGALLASNTSYLDLDAIASVTRRPQDVVGLHFFSPAHMMRLLEIVRAGQSSPQSVATALAVARRLGKQPVIARNAFGFIGNRLYAAYRRHCEFMLEEGALPHEIDAAMEAFGFAMGPFAVADMSGLDIAWNMRKAQAATRDPQARYVTIPDRLCEMGRLGRKTGAGYYRYSSGGRGERDPEIDTLIADAARAAGHEGGTFTAQAIQQRALLALVNEAALVLEEGIAEKPSDIDVTVVNGYGFPRWLGGPVYWALRQDPDWLERACDTLVEQAGPGTRRCNLALLAADPV